MKTLLLTLICVFVPLGMEAQDFSFTPYDSAMFDASGKLVDSKYKAGLGLGHGGSFTALVSTVCSTNQDNCFQVKGDVQYVQDASWSNGGTIITTTTNDPPFSSSDVGKIEFGTTNCGSSNGYINCLISVPQGTIVSVTDSHHAVVSLAATSVTSGLASWFAWGSQDDSLPLQNAMTKVLANQGGSILLPCKAMFVNSAPFIVSAPHLSPIQIDGCSGDTLFIPLPSFSQASCAAFGNSTSLKGCIFSDWEVGRTLYPSALVQTPYNNDYLRDFRVWGLGQDGTGLTARYTAIAGNNITTQNVSVVGWLWNQSNASQNNCSFDVSTSTLIDSYSWSANVCGVAIEGDSITAGQSVIVGGAYGPSAMGSGLVINGVAITSNGTHLTTSGSQFLCFGWCNDSTVVGALQASAGSVWRSYGDQISEMSINAGIAFLNGVQPFIGESKLEVVAGATVYAQNNSFVGGGLYLRGTIVDEGGNDWGPGPNVSSPAVVNGSASYNIVPAVAANIALSAGWGASATVTSMSGNSLKTQFTVTAVGTPSANPTFTFTFPVTNTQRYFILAPLCSAIQIGGTGAILPITNGTVTTLTTGAFSVTGLPVTGLTYIFQISCGNP